MRYLIFGLCVLAAACGNEMSRPSTSPSSAATGTAATEAKGGSALPFKGTLQATEKVLSEDDTLAVRHLEGSGEATHLGRYHLTADFTVNKVTGDATGTATWTAANNDQIFVTVFGHGDIVVFPEVTISEVHTITGGSGRFANASGTLRIARSGSILTGITSGTLSDEINLGH